MFDEIKKNDSECPLLKKSKEEITQPYSLDSPIAKDLKDISFSGIPAFSPGHYETIANSAEKDARDYQGKAEGYMKDAKYALEHGEQSKAEQKVKSADEYYTKAKEAAVKAERARQDAGEAQVKGNK